MVFLFFTDGAWAIRDYLRLCPRRVFEYTFSRLINPTEPSHGLLSVGVEMLPSLSEMSVGLIKW